MKIEKTNEKHAHCILDEEKWKIYVKYAHCARIHTIGPNATIVKLDM